MGGVYCAGRVWLSAWPERGSISGGTVRWLCRYNTAEAKAAMNTNPASMIIIGRREFDFSDMSDPPRKPNPGLRVRFPKCAFFARFGDEPLHVLV